MTPVQSNGAHRPRINAGPNLRECNIATEPGDARIGVSAAIVESGWMFFSGTGMAVTDLIQAQRANELRESRRIASTGDSHCTIRKFALFRQARNDLQKSLSYIIFGIVLARQAAAFNPTEAMRCKK